MLEEQLKKFGLSEKEAKTYLSLLKLGESTANDIAKESGVNRSSAYVVLEALIKKGLAFVSEGDSVQTFKAAPPEKLTHIADEQFKKHEDIKDTISKIIPSLHAADKDNKHSPNVRVYKGKKGLQEAYADILVQKQYGELLTYTNLTNLMKYVPDIKEQGLERIRNGSSMRAINPRNLRTLAMVKLAKLPGDTIILVPEEKYNFSSDFAIYGDTIGLVSPKEEFGLIIESKEMAAVMRSQFNIIWEASKLIGEEFKL